MCLHAFGTDGTPLGTACFAKVTVGITKGGIPTGGDTQEPNLEVKRSKVGGFPPGLGALLRVLPDDATGAAHLADMVGEFVVGTLDVGAAVMGFAGSSACGVVLAPGELVSPLPTLAPGELVSAVPSLVSGGVSAAVLASPSSASGGSEDGDGDDLRDGRAGNICCVIEGRGGAAASVVGICVAGPTGRVSLDKPETREVAMEPVSTDANGARGGGQFGATVLSFAVPSALGFGRQTRPFGR